MIFRPELVRAITLGKKSETRRPIRGDEPCRYKAGRSYAVQPGRGRPAVLRIVITDVRQARLGDIDYDGARAEGFRTRAEFCAYWVRLHDGAWIARQDALLDAESDLDDADRQATLDDRIPARFNTRWADRPVWVIRFEPSREDTPHLLAASPSSARSDYVTNPSQAAAGEPEAVTGADLDRLARRGAMTTVQWQALAATNAELEAQIRTIDERIMAARRAAQVAEIDVSREEYKVRSSQQAGRPPEVIERWLRVLERKAHTAILRRAA